MARAVDPGVIGGRGDRVPVGELDRFEASPLGRTRPCTSPPRWRRRATGRANEQSLITPAPGQGAHDILFGTRAGAPGCDVDR